MSPLPSLFISHGSPMLALRDSPARRFLSELGQSLARPRAILVASAHWETGATPSLSFAEQPQTIHDFGGFPAELFAIQYAAPGAPELAQRAAGLLQDAGVGVKRSPDRGLDHGAWVPLRLMYPEADIPVTQISILHGATPADHEKIGAALTALRDEGVLVIGSGSLTHNLAEITLGEPDIAAPFWVTEFGDWMNTMLEGSQHEALRDYRRLAPHAARNHPTEEHLLPLFLAMGAAGAQARARRLHASVEYGVLAMDVYAFSQQ